MEITEERQKELQKLLEDVSMEIVQDIKLFYENLKNLESRKEVIAQDDLYGSYKDLLNYRLFIGLLNLDLNTAFYLISNQTRNMRNFTQADK